jgi:hypothetical protein
MFTPSMARIASHGFSKNKGKNKNKKNVFTDILVRHVASMGPWDFARAWRRLGKTLP